MECILDNKREEIGDVKKDMDRMDVTKQNIILRFFIFPYFTRF